jgi:type IV pilus assembly protein PilC
MEYAYVAYTADKKLVKGKLSSTNEETAADLLSYGGYQVVSLKRVVPFFDKEKLMARFSRIKNMEIVLFSRQLALLLEAGTDIVSSLELLQGQVTNQVLRRIVAEVASDIRGGSPLSTAMMKHPQAFPQMYQRAISAGEQSGNLEVVLRQMADYMERSAVTEKKVKSALTYPIIVTVVAMVVVLILITFVLPSFTVLYASFDAELPLATRLLMGFADWFGQYGVFLLLGIGAVVFALFAYTKTPSGRYQLDRLSLNLPVLGRINLLNQLSRICRTMALLFKVGLPLPEVMAAAIYGTSNKVVSEALVGVQHDLIRGEGLSKPMRKRKVFLPLMVQMVGVGEETGSLDGTLTTVAESYEVEADDKTRAAVGMLQPALTLGIGLMVSFVVLALVSAMYSIYGQLNV